MRKRIDINKLNSLACVVDTLNAEYGAKGTSKRIEFDAKSLVWYYTEMIKAHRKSIGITQKQLAEKIGVPPRYISSLNEERLEYRFPPSSNSRRLLVCDLLSLLHKTSALQIYCQIILRSRYLC